MLTIMVFKTRLLDFIFSFQRKKDKWSINHFAQMLCLLLVGFLIGNLFGTFLNTIRRYIAWDGVIVFFLITFIEISNYCVYHNKDRPFLFFVIHPQKMKLAFWKYFNFLKIGLMVGFFVDAFKVGS